MTDAPAPFVFEPASEAKRFAPATQRNRDVLADVLRDILPKQGTVLEIASGTGEHIVHFAAEFPRLSWQPSDYDVAALASIAAWSAEAGLANVLPPVQIDAPALSWPVERADSLLCINMIHIAPWAATEGLFAGAARCLQAGSLLFLYGPFIEGDVPTATSNLAFDASLKARNPAWGLRNLHDVAAVAARHDFILERRIAMPANNISVVFRLQSI